MPQLTSDNIAPAEAELPDRIARCERCRVRLLAHHHFAAVRLGVDRLRKGGEHTAMTSQKDIKEPS